MAAAGLSSADAFLIEAAKTYFTTMYQSPSIAISSSLDSSLNWVPTLSFKVNSHLTIAAEVSETPYPLILRMRRFDVIKLQMPISVYCICPEQAYLADQPSAKQLMNDGYGLITVASDGTTQRRSGCIPLIQQITGDEFQAEIKSLPRKFRGRLAESFERYNHNAPSGTADIAEVMEGLILKAGRDATTKKWMTNAEAKGTLSALLSTMDQNKHFNNVRPAIGAAQAYISMYRNNAHHFPKNKKQAHQKYRDCRHAFLEGLKKIVFFRDSMRNIGLSGDLVS